MTALGLPNTSLTVSKLNDAGQVLGYVYNVQAQTGQVVLYTGGDYQFIASPMAGLIPADLNATGTIVGNYAPIHLGDLRPFVVENGAFRELNIYSGSYAVAQAINAKGQIAGYASKDNSPSFGSQTRGFLYDNGTVTDLGSLAGASANASTITRDINDNGQIVGQSTTTSGANHAFLWQNGTMRDLGVLNSSDGSSANAVNNKGQAVGNSGSEAGSSAVLFDNGAVQKLDLTIKGVAPSGSEANDINDSGQIVGYFRASDFSEHAFFYDHGLVVDLNQYILNVSAVDFVVARSINNKGQILVTDTVQGSTASYLLTPVTKAARVVGFSVSATKPASIAIFGKKR